MTQSPQTCQKHQKAFAFGLKAEALARFYLMLKGWRSLAGRYKTPVGEIDLIMKRGKTIIFVEVKARQDRAEALSSISHSQQQRIIRAARWWLTRHPHASDLTLRFDVVIIAKGQWPMHLVHAFQAG
jgi:putative endonuclease